MALQALPFCIGKVAWIIGTHPSSLSHEGTSVISQTRSQFWPLAFKSGFSQVRSHQSHGLRFRHAVTGVHATGGEARETARTTLAEFSQML